MRRLQLVTKAILATTAFTLALLSTFDVRAQEETASEARTAPPPATSWAGELETLTRWLEDRRHESTCQERCYVLDRLHITGDVEAGTFEFVLQGSVLADDAVAVPLFGPPSQVRVEQATLDTGPARIGFEETSYFLFTEARNFTLRGRLTLRDDRALSIAGPLNTLEVELTNGRMVEGERLSGLHATTIHFERGQGSAERDEPTVFQLARAIRVSREINFAYELVMRSGNDLGVVRLPLRFGEQVLEVTGSTGWRVDDGVLLLPTSGRTAEMTISGTLEQVATFSPDERSTYEWWLFESDAEHRVAVEGDGRQFDSSESPIERSQPNSRLFMVQQGQELQVSVTRLVSGEVLGAVVRSHDRTVVLTRQGDLVAQDVLNYENNGIDFLLFSPKGRPIYLATDGQSERIMHKSQGDTEVLIPLRTGTHAVKAQAITQHQIGMLWGRLEVPIPEYPLTASRTTLHLGLPRFVRPIVCLGGDEIEWFVGVGDGVALLLAILAALAVLRGRRRRILGSVVIGGLWFLSPVLYVLAMIVMILGGGIWVMSRFLSGAKLVVAAIAAIGFIGVVGLVPLVFVAGIESRAASSPSSADWVSEADAVSRSASEAEAPAGSRGRYGNRMAQQAVEGGLLEGVTPVALPLPRYHHSTRASRELVTEQRPFQPVLLYLTDWVLLPFVMLWLVCLALLGLSYRSELLRHYRWLKERLSHPPQSPQKTAVGSPKAPAPTPEPEPEPEPDPS